MQQGARRKEQDGRQQQPDEETDEEDDELLALEAAGVAPAQEQDQEQAVEEAEEARQLRREGAAIWRRSSGVTVSATDEEAAWARLTRWYSARIQASVGVGTPYEVGNDGDTVRRRFPPCRLVIAESHRGSAIRRWACRIPASGDAWTRRCWRCATSTDRQVW